MPHELLPQFTALVRFLEGTLGPAYEISLHDLTVEPDEIVAWSGEQPFPFTNFVAKSMMTYLKENNTEEWVNQTLPLPTGKTLRSSALLLRDATRVPFALLSVSFDDSRFQAFNESILKLVHPDAFVQHNYYPVEPPPTSTGTTQERMATLFREAAQALDLPLDRLNQNERVQVISWLRERGLFQFKGAVQYAAQQLHCSQASIYRYLNQTKEP